MRVLVLSNVQKGLDSVVGILDKAGHNIVAKEVSASTAELADMVSGELANGYDVCVVIAKDPIGLSMLLNKRSDIFAAVCNSADDVALGKSNNANVFVVRNPKSTEIEPIVSAISKLGYSKNFFKLSLPKFQLRFSSSKPQQPVLQQKKQKEEQELEEDEEEEQEEQLGKGSKGMLGKLKNALGIV
ncbi:MAG: RpiB/LacA/LacB family sugar-phosphate isomerase, partial [Candidatus Micrarchaeia archaeon]